MRTTYTYTSYALSVYDVRMSRTKAPKRRLSRDAVLGEAMALLDEAGLDGLTMRALAERLDVAPMALYRHVSNKDDLLDGVLDQAVAGVEIPSHELGWREGLAALAHAIRATMLAHPGIVPVVVDRPSLGPSSLGIGEFAFTVLLRDGFAPELAERSLNSVLTYTLGFAALEVPRIRIDPTTSRRAVDRLDEGYAALPPALSATAAVAPSPARLVGDEQFTFGLDCILDSLERRRAARR